MTFLNILANAVGYNEGNTLTIKVEILKAGVEPELRVLVTPQLKPLGKSASDEQASKRAALRTPLVVTGTATEVEAQLAQHIASHKKHMTACEESIAQMNRNANAADKAATAAQNKPGTADTNTQAQTEPAEQSDSETTEPNQGGSEPVMGDFNSL